jgi:hypothetical protein
MTIAYQVVFALELKIVQLCTDKHVQSPVKDNTVLSRTIIAHENSVFWKVAVLRYVSVF